MAYETLTLASVPFTRLAMRDDSALLQSSSSTFEVPDTIELGRTLPRSGSNPVTRGKIKTILGYKDAAGKVHLIKLETTSSCPVSVPAATLAAALDRHQAALANEALATDVLTKGVVY